MIRLASLLVYNLGSPYLVHKLIIYASYQSGMRHLTLTLFLRSTDCYIYIKFLWLAKFHYYQTTFPGLTLFGPYIFMHISP